MKPDLSWQHDITYNSRRQKIVNDKFGDLSVRDYRCRENIVRTGEVRSSSVTLRSERIHSERLEAPRSLFVLQQALSLCKIPHTCR